ncbi:MAG: hypothetical protein ACRBB0_11100 [Pelagimonas sp.]|uniref:hypothetical protein n=1 Tax=Pelagimonas sp. TaxID=2073170 RepID=UPI003D6B2989
MTPNGSPLQFNFYKALSGSLFKVELKDRDKKPSAGLHPFRTQDPAIRRLGILVLNLQCCDTQAQQNIVRRLGNFSFYGTQDHVARPPELWRAIDPDGRGTITPLPTRLIATRSNDFHVQMSASEAGFELAVLPHNLAVQSIKQQRANTPAPPIQPARLVIHPDIKSTLAIRVVSDAILKVFSTQKPSAALRKSCPPS